MADLESQSIVLEDYESVLEELTFNSKPIINMLTMKADKYRIYAPAIVELVKTRFFKVVPHRTPWPSFLSSLLNSSLNVVCIYLFVLIVNVCNTSVSHNIVNNNDNSFLKAIIKICKAPLFLNRSLILSLNPSLYEVMVCSLGAARVQDTNPLPDGLYDQEPGRGIPRGTHKRDRGRVLPRLRITGMHCVVARGVSGCVL